MHWIVRSVLLGLLLVVLLILFNSHQGHQGHAESDGLPLGTAAPEIAGTDQDGKAFKLSDYRGKVVMLDFWFST